MLLDTCQALFLLDYNVVVKSIYDGIGFRDVTTFSEAQAYTG